VTTTVPGPTGGIVWAPDSYPVPGAWYSAGTDPAGRVTVLHGLFSRLGHPDVLSRSRADLQRADELGLESRQRVGQARARWSEADAAFLAGTTTIEEYDAALQQAERWFDPDPAGLGDGGVAPAVAALNRKQRDLNARAATLLPAESPGLYQLAQREARAAVEATAAAGKLPASCWGSPDPAAVAMEHGAEQVFVELQRQQQKFALCHQIGGLLRRVGGLGASAMLPGGVPEVHGFAFRRWDLAMEGDRALRLLKPALRLRYSLDHGWLPGLYLAGDISANPVEVKPDRRRLLSSWVSR
jgi:hypothetical protein